MLVHHVGAAYDWQVGTGFRFVELAAPQASKPGFTRQPASFTGIVFTNHLSDAKAAENQNRLSGSGVAVGDIDGDGLVDLYFCRLEGPNVLYRNCGNWKFEDITPSAGVACSDQYSTGAVFADVDGDGDLDLLVTALGGGTRLFLNGGSGHFTEAANAGLVRKFAATTMALGDVDGDGTLDLYVANYRTTTVRSTGLEMLNVNGKRMLKPEDRESMYFTPDGFLREFGEADILCLNDGKGAFTPLSWTEGRFLDEVGKPLSSPPKDWGLAVMFHDMNGDGAPDIYVCNDFWTPDRIWINDGKGIFRAISRVALCNTSTFSMGVDFADINRDGFDDFVVLDMLSPVHVRRLTQRSSVGGTPMPIGLPAERPQVERNTLYLNRGDGTYAEIAQFSGVQASDWSWCPIFLDVDLDGYEDMLVSTGHGFDTQDADTNDRIDAMGPFPRERVHTKLLMYSRLDRPNLAFRNRGDLTFEEVSGPWGFDTRGVSHGMALGDLDNDGDLDVVVNNLNGAAGVYRNESAAPRVAVRLKGLRPNTRGIGAKLWLYGGAVPMQSQEMICGGRYLSSDDPMRVFAAGSLTNQMRIEVRWRSGKRSVVNGVKANRIYEIDEAQATSNLEPRTSNLEPRPVFEDVSGLIHHAHHEQEYDDFARQPLLGRKLSQLGPGVGWYDVDGDGWEDLILGSGKGGTLTVCRNDARGGFQRMSGTPWAQIATRDQTGVLGWGKAPGQTVILAGSANYEDGLAVGPCLRQYDLTSHAIDDSLPGQASSTGPLALGDVNGDGQLSLFVGGRVIPGRYPEAASSKMFRQVDGKWAVDAENTKRLERVGLVSGAVFSDLDNDGKPELILACEWGPIKVFHNEGRQFKEVTRELGLDGYTGWWNGVTTGDLDGDGRLDIIASNWGRNTRYESHRAKPLRVYYGDFDGNGTVDMMQAYYDLELKKEVPEEGLDFMTKGMPFIRERFSTHRAYAEASVKEILGERMKEAKELQVTTLESMVFMNRADHFEAKALPSEAQLAPGFAVCVGDFDGDGNEDVFLSQNFFATQPETAPNDAGRGLLLKGDGKGNLRAVPGQESGVKVYGEQRGAALCDYDGDGRVDLVVAQNGGETKLYHNAQAKPGLRVRLNGPPGNPKGVGAQMRLICGQRPGPVREVQAGSGYWSQDSAVQVLAIPESPTQIWIRWPGGKVTTAPLPPKPREVAVNPEGQIKIVVEDQGSKVKGPSGGATK